MGESTPGRILPKEFRLGEKNLFFFTKGEYLLLQFLLRNRDGCRFGNAQYGFPQKTTTRVEESQRNAIAGIFLGTK